MSLNSTSIQWTQYTWNPITGCTQLSPGCDNCYAKGQAPRLKAMGISGYTNDFHLTLNPERLEKPLRLRKGRMIFTNSMSDTFHVDVPDDFLDQMFDVIRCCPHHIFQVLTKRADRMLDYFSNRDVPDNVWLGVTVENRQHGLPRIDYLKQINAKVRFLSVEPLLEDLGHIDLTDIHQVIVGGESGSKARRMHPDWVRNIRDICIAQDTPFFFKQWGTWGADGIKRRGKKNNGNELDGQIYMEFPDL